MVQIDEAAEVIDPTSGGLASRAHPTASCPHDSRRRGTRLILTGLSALAAIALTLSATLSALADEPRFFRIGTAGSTGTYFQIGGILASAISSPPGSPNCQRGGNCGVPGLIAVAQATQGSVENVDLIGRAQLESALSQADIASWAFHGTGIYKAKGAVANLRAIGALFPESVHVVVAQDNPIKTLRDLKGKRVGLGEKESGTLADARIVLEAAGLSERDVKPDYSRLGEAAAGIRDKTLDAFFVVGGYPIPALAELAVATPIRLLPIGDDIFDKLKKRYPFFSRTSIPADAYTGLDGETATAGLNALWVVAANVPDQIVYEITKSLWSESTRKFLASRHVIGRRIAPERALDGVDIPLHPGAEQYYRENALLTDPPK
jgi:TRAP transporter TAXI family solute receptor